MRKKTSHKGQNGRVLIIGGSEEYSGAPMLAGLACLRLGADLVTIATPEKSAWIINCTSPDLLTAKLKGKYITSRNSKKINELIEINDIILIGPGLSKNKKTASFIKKLIEKTDKPKVIDADAINCANIEKIKNAIFTPHIEEYKQIKNKTINNNIIVLKGKEDKIITSFKTYKNKNGNEGMTVGGTGDILAGLIAGYLSQKHNMLNAAKKATKLNGKIGDKLKKELDYGFIASDFLRIIAKEGKKIK